MLGLPKLPGRSRLFPETSHRSASMTGIPSWRRDHLAKSWLMPPGAGAAVTIRITGTWSFRTLKRMSQAPGMKQLGLGCRLYANLDGTEWVNKNAHANVDNHQKTVHSSYVCWGMGDFNIDSDRPSMVILTNFLFLFYCLRIRFTQMEYSTTIYYCKSGIKRA